MPEQAQKKLDRLITTIAEQASRAGIKDKERSAFLKAFFTEAVYEDLACYQTADLARLAASAWDFTSQRRSGKPKIRLYDPKFDSGCANDGISIIEISNDDMPFLVDSVMAGIAERGLEIYLVLHPIISFKRNKKGKRTEFLPDRHDADLRESLIHIHVKHIAGRVLRDSLKSELAYILEDVRTVVTSWKAMQDRLSLAIDDFHSCPPPVPVDELAETIQFLKWLAADNFLFLGMREFTFENSGKSSSFEEVKGSGLGILADRKVKVLRRGLELVTMTPEVREFLMQPAPLIITKANVRARVHRRVHMDYVGVKQYDTKGALTGELRIAGLFTATAYTGNVRSIPLLRHKADIVIRRSGLERSTHSGRAITNVLDSYPRDEMFQIGTDKLFEFTIGILQLYERPRARIFVRRDKFDRFVSVLVFVPKEAYDTALRVRIGEILSAAYDGAISAFYPTFPTGALARVHYIIGRYKGQTPDPDQSGIEADIAQAARSWDGNLQEALARLGYGAIAQNYQGGFPKAYQNTFDVQDGLLDVNLMEQLGPSNDLVIDFYDHEEYAPSGLRLKMFHPGGPIALSDRLPILENMGFRAVAERSYPIKRQKDNKTETIWYHSISIETANSEPANKATLEGLLEDAFLAVWTGRAEDDGHNALVGQQAMDWRSVSILRACTHYLRQAGVTYSRAMMARTLSKHGHMAYQLMELFRIRFDSSRENGIDARNAAQQKLKKKFETALEDVVSLDEDNILRHYLDLISAMLRTNACSKGAKGHFSHVLAFKIRSKELTLLPRPRPYAEIFVCSPRVQGVHLRGGPIARGGIRWSDRREDFRTEVLGLMKAQQVKNAVIVPVGSKGGFIPRHLDTSAPREQIIKEGIACYKLFINALLEITDNLNGANTIPPPGLIRYDGDDPYLVVAADKGTASFSDIANEISLSRNYWLGDAFASGGSAGYDHKKMGITARGAWEAVKRHFRETGINIQKAQFSVIGVGDMSGDVFGNGMLLSDRIELIAAFDHRDIFIDPEPDPAASFAERRRLFNIPRSSWRDYNQQLISRGGGVFSRSAKSIPLSPQIQEMARLNQQKTTPNELIHALLGAEADLLWFGGIGTYVRADDETDAQTGDRVNDAIRISAKKLQARVIGEGANLGLTQRARIEFAQNGGRINTDAIDNSAGVNTSDIEVNIKIALQSAIANDRLKKRGRNTFLARMTDQVGGLALENNYRQSLAITLDEARGINEIGAQARLMAKLEQKHFLDRELEFLPGEMELAERREELSPLTRPELAVLLSYSKNSAFKDLLTSPVTEDEWFVRDLMAYFPKSMHRRLKPDIKAHKLRREIVATLIANDMINRTGIAWNARIADETGAGPDGIAAAYVMARDIFDMPPLFEAVDALDNAAPADFQTRRYIDLQNMIRRHTLWFLRNGPRGQNDLGAIIPSYRKIVRRFTSQLEEMLDPDVWQKIINEKNRLIHSGLSEAAALRFAAFPVQTEVLDIIRASQNAKRKPEDATRVFFAIGQTLGLDRLLAQAATAERGDYFGHLAFRRMIGDTGLARRLLTEKVLAGKGRWDKQIAIWLDENSESISRTRHAIEELSSGGPLTLARLTLANGYLHDLIA